HRTSTVALADRVALLDGGRVVAVGTHTELMASSARYRWVIAHQEEERRREQDIETLTGELELRAIQAQGRWPPPSPTRTIRSSRPTPPRTTGCPGSAPSRCWAS